MKAFVNKKYGSPDVLELQEVETPVPKNNEVLIKVRASSINSWDYDILTGKPYMYRMFSGLFRPKFNILGCDIAGQIEATGKNVTKFQPGDEVLGDLSHANWGGFAEYVCADENDLAIKPKSMTYEEAAAVPQAGVLALQCLRYNGEIQPRQKILINGAGGGVGTFGIQMAKLWGAEVTGIDCKEKLDLIRSLGADHALDYTKTNFTKNGKTYDLILDVVSNHSLFDYKRTLNLGGAFVMVGGSHSTFYQVILLGRIKVVTGDRRFGLLLHKPDPADLQIICELFEASKVKPVIDRCYPLSEVPEAFRYFGEGRVQGKAIITMNQ